jgi:hypothetical protein
MKRIVLVLALIGSTTLGAQAGTNYPALADYPAANCARPEKPDDSAEYKVGEDVAAFNKRAKKHNEQVAQYNGDLHQYTACMNDYVANAQADMNFIRDKANKAVAGQASN